MILLTGRPCRIDEPAPRLQGTILLLPVIARQATQSPTVPISRQLALQASPSTRAALQWGKRAHYPLSCNVCLSC